MGGCFSTVKDTAAAGLKRQISMDKIEAHEAAVILESVRGLVSQIDLSISASGIANLDTFSRSDPVAVLREKQANGTWREIGRTEVIANTTEPKFVKMMRILYMFEKIQPMQIQLYDVDTDISNQMSSDELCLPEQDYIGEIDFCVSELFTDEMTLSKSITNKLFPSRAKGTIRVRAEEVRGQNDKFKLRLRAEGLPKKDIFYEPDPFIVISRLAEDNIYTRVYKTEVLKRVACPMWGEINVSSQQICNGDLLRPLKLECYDWYNNGSHVLIGDCSCTLEELRTKAENQEAIYLTHATNRSCGRIYVHDFTIEPYYGFLDFIAGGLGINFMVAIDFTTSNGAASEPGSLHYQDPTGRLNPYQAAINAVGEVLEFYDSDKRFPVWGFGGAFAGLPVSHCFPLNGNPHDPEVVGLRGILDAYAFAIQNTRLAGPTLFTPIINTAIAYASQEEVTQENQEYFVLLIITDGVIGDMASTVASIVKASTLPLSLLIVGVGDTDFTAMEYLDADKYPLSFKGKQASRDIVQFVPLAQVRAANPSNFNQEIARELLAELPYQVLEYMRRSGICPNDPSKRGEQMARREATNRKPAPLVTHPFPPGALQFRHATSTQLPHMQHGQSPMYGGQFPQWPSPPVMSGVGPGPGPGPQMGIGYASPYAHVQMPMPLQMTMQGATHAVRHSGPIAHEYRQPVTGTRVGEFHAVQQDVLGSTGSAGMTQGAQRKDLRHLQTFNGYPHRGELNPRERHF